MTNGEKIVAFNFFFTLQSLMLHINLNLKQLVEYQKMDCYSDLFAKFLSEQDYMIIISQLK